MRKPEGDRGETFKPLDKIDRVDDANVFPNCFCVFGFLPFGFLGQPRGLLRGEEGELRVVLQEVGVRHEARRIVLDPRIVCCFVSGHLFELR